MANNSLPDFFSTITPQLQLAYSSFIPSDFNGLHASELAYSNFNSLIARAGGSFRSTINRTASSATDLTIDANYYRELLDNQSTFNIGPTTLDAGIAAKNTVELGMGFTRRWAHGNQTAFGRMNVKINPLDPRDAYQISGNIGYRLGW
ncbi:autotransporter outer membrane beta-barrel domain-containing protein [Ochrobactrum haematophilum]|uniref:Autotransporter outer membrane beta-barrel domain-containing protein n=1 Tax=Brucella haematophila TaxID=419474 RepID=A0ABX1DMC3_9HYPH|nr:autotransporter outer membrane beta-barrel domain-containing protein [Brucella haematophila]